MGSSSSSGQDLLDGTTEVVPDIRPMWRSISASYMASYARMAKRYCHIGNVAQMTAVKMLMVDCDDDESATGGHKKGHSDPPLSLSEHRKLLKLSGSSGWTRTSNPPVNSRMLCH